MTTPDLALLTPAAQAVLDAAVTWLNGIDEAADYSITERELLDAIRAYREEDK